MAAKVHIIVFHVPQLIARGTELTFDYDGGHPSVQDYNEEQAQLQEGAPAAGKPFKWADREVKASPLAVKCMCGAGDRCRGHFFVNHGPPS